MKHERKKMLRNHLIPESDSVEVGDSHLKQGAPAIEAPEMNLDQKTWISLGHQMFYVDDVYSMYIQANHLIINFDYSAKQIVIFFGHGEKGYLNAKTVFDSLSEMYKAHQISLPKDAQVDPDIMKTAYAEEINRKIQDSVKYEKDKIKGRYIRKFDKLRKEIEYLKNKTKQSC